MKKIPSLFYRSDDDPNGICIDSVNPLCEWVMRDEGIATAKFDGTACAVIKGKIYKRYDNSRLISKDNRVQKTKPLDTWVHCDDHTDRGKFIYWIPLSTTDYYHHIAWAWEHWELSDGTYELVGPGVQDNPHNFSSNGLVRHGCILIHALKPSYDSIRDFLKESSCEGIVWHHPDGRMAKITKEKFGFPWPII